MGNLLDDEFFIRFAFFSVPKDPVRVSFHVLDILPGTIVLLLREGDRETGFYFACLHDIDHFAIGMPVAEPVFGSEIGVQCNPVPVIGQNCSGVLQ